MIQPTTPGTYVFSDRVRGAQHDLPARTNLSLRNLVADVKAYCKQRHEYRRIGATEIEAAQAMTNTNFGVEYVSKEDYLRHRAREKGVAPTQLAVDDDLLSALGITNSDIVSLLDAERPGAGEIDIKNLELGYFSSINNHIFQTGYIIKNKSTDNDHEYIDTLHHQGHRLLVNAFSSANKDKIYVCFAGMTGANKHEFTNILKTLTGYPSREMAIARKVISAYKAKYPDKQIIAVGHSMGGGLATYAAIKNHTSAVTFNAMGLSHLRLQDHFRHKKQILQINSKKDPLHRLQQPFLHQYGKRLTVPGESKHNLVSAADQKKIRFADELQTLVSARENMQ